MSIEGIDNYVYLDKESHRYYDRDGREYESVSRFIGRFSKPFDRELISRMSAKKKGVSQDSLLAEWDKKRDDSIDHGNRIHDALEKFEKTTLIDPSNEDLRPMILSVNSVYKDYYRRHAEVILYDSEELIAGTTDKLLQTTSHKNCVIDFDDFKTNLKKGIQYKNEYGNYMLGPVSHLMDCNYNKYALQLSIYAYLFQKKTGRKIGALNLMFIPPTDMLGYKRIPTPYLKAEVEAMFEYRRQTINQTLQIPVSSTVVEDDDF